MLNQIQKQVKAIHTYLVCVVADDYDPADLDNILRELDPGN